MQFYFAILFLLYKIGDYLEFTLSFVRHCMIKMIGSIVIKGNLKLIIGHKKIVTFNRKGMNIAAINIDKEKYLV